MIATRFPVGFSFSTLRLRTHKTHIAVAGIRLLRAKAYAHDLCYRPEISLEINSGSAVGDGGRCLAVVHEQPQRQDLRGVGQIGGAAMNKVSTPPVAMPKLNPHVAQRRRASAVIRDQLQRMGVPAESNDRLGVCRLEMPTVS